MFSFKNSDQFLKSENVIFKRDDISSIDCSNVEELKLTVLLSSGISIPVEGIHALELIMQVKPSMLEGRRIKGYKASKIKWFLHNMLGHPLLQLFALLRLYKIAFWIHEVTVPNHKCKNK